jgi:hypothetical protein
MSTLLPNAPAGLPGDRPLHAKRRLAVFGSGAAAYLVFFLLASFPAVAESLVAPTHPRIAWTLSRISALLPFSVTEVALVAYLAAWLTFLGRTLRAVVRGQRSRKNAGQIVGLVVLRDVGAITFCFYMVWGFGYARPPLAERMGWPVFTAPDSAELIDLAEESVRNLNAAYLVLHGVDDVGHATRAADREELDDAIEAGFARATTLLGLRPSVGWKYGRAKEPVFSSLMARFGVQGQYSPLTGEPLVVPQPVLGRSLTIAHEKAHQRGVNPELEARFLSYVAASLAPHAAARYSAAYYMNTTLVRELARDERVRLAGLLLPGVRRDARDRAEWWRPFRNSSARAVGAAVNDRFLRANQVAGGIANYGLAVRLLIELARQTGSLDPGGEA